MEIKSYATKIRISPRKVRVVAKTLVGLNALEALEALKFVNRKSAPLIAKVIKTAMADAEANFKLNKNRLRIKEIVIEEGQSLKRSEPRSRGMANPIKKRAAHIKIKLEDY